MNQKQQIQPLRKSVEENRVIATKHKNQIKPSLREEIDRMMLQNDASLTHDRFQVIEQLRVAKANLPYLVFRVLVNNQTLELLIPSRAEMLPFHLQRSNTSQHRLQYLQQ